MTTVYRDKARLITVSVNDSGEIFIEQEATGSKMRISDNSNGFVVTAHGMLIRPTSVNGLDAFKVTAWPA